MKARVLIASIWLGLAANLNAAEPLKVALDSTEGLTLINVKGEAVEHRGRKGVRLTFAGPKAAKTAGGEKGKESPSAKASPKAPRGPAREFETLAILTGSEFRNGTIEIELAGEPAPGGAPGGARGFVGLAFHVDPADPSRYDAFYIRPTNGRADDQVRRNHSTQYISHPEFPWARLREEFPAKYESYADLAPSEWTRLKIVVAGSRAQLYVNGASQPSLIVNDLKRADATGPIALWTEPSTISHFRDLVIAADAIAP
ncbi:family 16 glycoside hydrolase [Singulisphaera sp. PoT]|uniref:family 16 glycoside hydrolase n=1 Tax=Singulisphaera sp. PoT TaxID=3411797 RepID=UPI003BF53B42